MDTYIKCEMCVDNASNNYFITNTKRAFLCRTCAKDCGGRTKIQQAEYKLRLEEPKPIKKKSAQISALKHGWCMRMFCSCGDHRYLMALIEEEEKGIVPPPRVGITLEQDYKAFARRMKEKIDTDYTINVGDIFRDFSALKDTLFLKVISVSKTQVKCQYIIPARMNEWRDKYYEYWIVEPSNPENIMDKIVSQKKAYFKYRLKYDEVDNRFNQVKY